MYIYKYIIYIYIQLSHTFWNSCSSHVCTPFDNVCTGCIIYIGPTFVFDRLINFMRCKTALMLDYLRYTTVTTRISCLIATRTVIIKS